MTLVVAASLLAAAGPAAAAPPPWYPPLRWLPAAPGNFSPGRAGTAIGLIVIHATEGSYAGALSWFGTPGTGLSAHYVIRAADGQVTQMVAEADTAFQARGFNRGSIGIEHELDPGHGIGFTETLYRSSATLVCAIARRYGIPADRAHIVGHSELPGTDHRDPGPSWDWAHYLALVGQCAGPGSSAAPSASDASVAPCWDARCLPDPGLARGAAGPAVTRLQSALASLGRMSQATVQAGDGRFGPLTDAAVRRFQDDVGLPATGFYGPLTAAALARALAAAAPVPSGEVLAFGDRSAAVAELQRALGRLGYLDVVTGYFGPLTRDAVRRFQQDRGIVTTGNYGPLTRAALAATR